MSAPFSAISPLRPVNSRKVIYFGQIYDATGNAIEMQEQTGDFKEWLVLPSSLGCFAPVERELAILQRLTQAAPMGQEIDCRMPSKL